MTMNRDWAKSIVELSQYIWFALMIVVSVPAFFSIMMFDAPGSDKPATYLLAGSLMSCPIACGLSVLMSERSIKTNALLSAFLWAMLPLVNIAVGSAGWAWISWMQGGRFNG
jgi:hypothetical protein